MKHGDNSTDGIPVIYDSHIENDKSGVNSDSSHKLEVDDCDSDKFIYSMIYHKHSRLHIPHSDCQSYAACKSQSKYDFSFVPLTDPVLPVQEGVTKNDNFQLKGLRELQRMGHQIFWAHAFRLILN